MNCYGRPITLSRIGLYFARALSSGLSRPVKRADNPYATHVPVLIGIAHLLQVRRVLEFGSGQYTTLTFLDRAAFPDLISICSLENDPVWLQRIAAQTAHDGRIKLTFVEAPMASSAETVSYDGYDLVFVDDSTREADRAATIRAVGRRCSAINVVILHDFEVPSYRDAASTLAKSLPSMFTFTALSPYTGISWGEAPLNRKQLRRLNSLIKRFAGLIEPEDRNAWVKVIHGGIGRC